MARHVETLFRHKVRFAALALIPVVLAAGVMVTFVSYRATATLSVADPSSFGASFVPIGWSQSATPAQNLAEAASEAVMLPAFSQALSAELSGSGATSAAEARQIVSSIGTDLKIGVSGAHLVTLTYSCHRPDLCVQILSTVITSLRKQLIQSERDKADSATRFWTAELQDAEANLNSAQTAVQSYAAANPGVKVDANSTDPQVVLLLDGVKQWQAKVTEARDSLSLTGYTSSTSALMIEVGTSVVGAPSLATPGFTGDRSSLKLSGLVLVAGWALILAYLVILGWSDRTIRDPLALEREFGVPVLASIPKLVGSRGF